MGLLGKCFARRPALGRYRGSRADWDLAYRAARARRRLYPEPDATNEGLFWKAQLVVYFDRERAPYSAHPQALKLLRDVCEHADRVAMINDTEFSDAGESECSACEP